MDTHRPPRRVGLCFRGINANISARQWFDAAVHDLRDAFRSLSRNKAFTCAAVANLALGIGATTAIFTVVNAVVLQPMPFPAPDRLVQLSATPIERGDAVALADLDGFRRESPSFEAIAAYAVTARYVRAAAGSERVMTVVAERSLFSTLGVAPLAGRTFAANDPASVAVISHEFWTRWLGGDASAIGTTLSIDGDPFTVIGVMPAAFQFPYGNSSTIRGVESETRLDLWVPLYPLGQPLRGRAAAVGRLKPHVAREAAESELNAIATRRDVLPTDAALRGRSVRLETLSDAVVAGSVRRPLFLLLAAVVMVLALACANVMNFSLVRMTLRGQEVAVRAALGAGPRRLVRPFLTETLVLTALGGAVGFWIAEIATTRLRQYVGAHLPRVQEIAIDWSVFLFLLGVCAVTGGAVALMPALAARHVQPQSLLRESGGHTMSATERRLRDGLVVLEVALAFMLAMAASLLARELLRLRQVDAGLVTTNVVTFHLGHRSTPRTDTRQFYEIADRVRQLPGVDAAGFTQMLPLQNWGWFSTSADFTLAGQPPVSPALQIELRYVTPGYFEAMGIPVRRGQVFTDRDTATAPRVIVINETLARRYFGDRDPVGAATNRGTIAGVVRDVRQVHLDRPANPEIYYPVSQNWSQLSELGMTLVVKTEERGVAIIDPVRAVVRQVNPALAVFNIKTLDTVIDESLSPFTTSLSLMSVFAVLALVLACTGTYGVMSYVATARMREFAIRLAIGASGARLRRLVVLQGLRLAALGVLVGLGGAVAAAPLLQSLPVTVRPPDVATIVPISLFIAAIAMAASLVPAVRAARVDAMTVLRNQ